MKTLLTIFILTLSINIKAQTKNNTHIDQANTVNIYSGNTSIGQIIINESPGSKVYLTQESQEIDTTKNHKGEYKTVFTLIGENGVVMNKVITLGFDKPVISCAVVMPHGGSIMNTRNSYNGKTVFRFGISQLSARDFQFVIYSSDKIFTKMDGITAIVAH